MAKDASVTLDTLLELQDRDIAIDRLRHRRDTLPERAGLASVRTELEAVEKQLADAVTLKALMVHSGQSRQLASRKLGRGEGDDRHHRRSDATEQRLDYGQPGVPHVDRADGHDDVEGRGDEGDRDGRGASPRLVRQPRDCVWTRRPEGTECSPFSS